MQANIIADGERMQVTFDFLNHRHARTVPLSSAGVAPLPPVFHKLLSVTVTTFNALFFLSWMYFATTIACCLCHLVRDPPSPIAVGKVAKFTRRQLIPPAHCGFPPNANDLPVLLSCQCVTCSTIPVLSA